MTGTARATAARNFPSSRERAAGSMTTEDALCRRAPRSSPISAGLFAHSLLMRLTQAQTGSATVLVDKLDAAILCSARRGRKAAERSVRGLWQQDQRDHSNLQSAGMRKLTQARMLCCSLIGI